MSLAENPRAVPGSNSAGDQFPIIRDRVDVLSGTANAWLQQVKEITDAETATACEDFIAQVKAEIKAAEDERKKQKQPHMDAGAAVDEKFRPLQVTLKMIADLLSPLKTGWLKREQERLKREAEEKEAAALKALEEAETAKATAPTTIEEAVRAEQAQKKADEAVADADRAGKSKAQLKGAFTSRATSLRTYWSARIVDYRMALLHYGEHDEVKAVIQKLADADARTHKETMNIPGCESQSEQKAA